MALRLTCIILLLLSAGCGAREDAATDAPVLSVWGGPGRTKGFFHSPRVVDAWQAKVYVIDKTDRLQVFDVDGMWQATWAIPRVGKGYPSGMGIRGDGVVAIADTHDYVVRLYNSDGEEIKTIGREGGGEGEFTYLTDVGFDKAGNMYVSEHGRMDRIQKFDSEGRFVMLWGATGEAPGEFQRPQSIVVNDEGLVCVADAANHRIQKFTADGKLIAVWGTPGDGSGELKYPYDLALAPGGILLVCEYGNNRVQAFDGEGRSVGIWGEPGRGRGQVAAPWAVAWLPDRGIVVADTENHRIQVFASPELTRKNVVGK